MRFLLVYPAICYCLCNFFIPFCFFAIFHIDTKHKFTHFHIAVCVDWTVEERKKRRNVSCLEDIGIIEADIFPGLDLEICNGSSEIGGKGGRGCERGYLQACTS